MSKPVRIRDHVAGRVEVFAASERRAFANMVEVLLEDALDRRVAVLEGQSVKRSVLTERGSADGTQGDPAAASPRAHETKPPRSVSADVAATIPGVTVVRPHMRKDRPAIECGERVLPGSVCGVCGADG